MNHKFALAPQAKTVATLIVASVLLAGCPEKLPVPPATSSGAAVSSVDNHGLRVGTP
jgi:hypothetical protein